MKMNLTVTEGIAGRTVHRAAIRNVDGKEVVYGTWCNRETFTIDNRRRRFYSAEGRPVTCKRCLKSENAS